MRHLKSDCRWAVCLVIATVGCSKPDYASIAEQAKQKVEQAIEASEAGDNQRAVDLISEAMRSGGVGRDRMFQACRCRAICSARLGDFDTALMDVEALSEVAPDYAEAEVVRSYVLEKQGKKSQAVAAYRRAKKINKKIQRIKD